MWIQNLLLGNIQSFKYGRLKFGAGINILVGRNNSGKSAIIRSLINFQRNSIIKPEMLLRRFEEQGFVLATLIDASSSPTGIRTFTDDKYEAVIFDAKSKNISWLMISEPKESDRYPHDYIENLQLSGESTTFNQYPDEEPKNAFIAFLAKRKLQYLNGQFDEASAVKVDHDFRGLPAKLSKARSTPSGKEFEEACHDILGFVPSTLPGVVNMNVASLGHYVDANESISIDQMGDGVAQITGMLVSLFNAKGKIFLIEEIENDLHPEALKKLLAHIIKASKQNQFIISTHSNIVLSTLGAIDNCKIFETKSELVVDKEYNTSLFSSQVKEVNNMPEERIRVLSELGYELSDLHLRDGYLILEESSAEKIIRDFLIPAFCPQLANRLGTVGAKGAGDVPLRFSHLHSVFTYVHTAEIYRHKGWVCVDGDPAGIEALGKIKESFKSWGEDHFISFSKKDFEDFYPSGYEDKISLIKREQNHEERGKLKLSLAKSIVEEFLRDNGTAKQKFQQSAKEVIEILKKIETKLLANDES